MLRKNEKGGAAAVAIMVIIMALAIVSTILVVTGRFAINKADVDDTLTKAESEVDSSSLDISESDLSSVVTEPEPVNLYPAESAGYQDINIKDLTCSEAILINADTNEIVAGLNYEKRIYPASLTKILTLMVAVENSDDLSTTYKFTDDDIDPLIEENASMAGFLAGDEVTAKDLLFGCIMRSGADATLGLAKIVSGSEDEFVKLMDQKLVDLGLSDTTKFVNATGLHDKNHYTTVQDVAVLMKAAMESKTCRTVLTTGTYDTDIKNENYPDGLSFTSIVFERLDGYYIDCDGDGEGDDNIEVLGGKTGFTDEAMFTLALAIEKDGTNYICVTAHSEQQDKSVEDTIAIIEKYLATGKRASADEEETEEPESSETEEETGSDESHKVSEDTDTIKVGA